MEGQITSSPELSFGEKLAGTTFNPSNDGSVEKVKQAAASFMNAIDDARKEARKDRETSANEELIWESAIMRSLESQMLAVKAITWKY